MPTEYTVERWQMETADGSRIVRIFARRQDAMKALNRTVPHTHRVVRAEVKVRLTYNPHSQENNGRTLLEDYERRGVKSGYCPIPEALNLLISAQVGDEVALDAWLDCLAEYATPEMHVRAKKLAPQMRDVWEGWGLETQRSFVRLALQRGYIDAELHDRVMETIPCKPGRKLPQPLSY